MTHHNRRCRALWIGLAGLAMLAATESSECRGQEARKVNARGPEHGTLVICGGGILPDPLRQKVVDLAGGEQARVVIISTASQTADSPDLELYVAWWRQQKFAELTILHTRSREEADRAEFSEPLTRATGVWFLGGNQAWLIDTYSGTRTETELHKLLERGGVIGGTSAGAAVMSRLMIRRGTAMVEVGRGFGFLDGAIVDQHFVRRFRQDRLLKVLEQYPELVGLGIDECTALVVQGRRLSVIGDSEVRICFARTETQDARMETLRRNDEADLVSLSRIATARLQPPTLLAESVPRVRDGTLVIVGGEDIPAEATERFAAAAGADAIVAVVSLDGDEDADAESSLMDDLRKAGVKNVQRVQVTTRKEVEDPKFVALLKTARGIWFSGSRQHRFVESCVGTVTEELCHDVLRRGGVIGGTASGGLMQGELPLKSSPMPNHKIVLEGCDRGFSFLPGVAIAQSFNRREPSDGMVQFKHEHPQVVGLGIEDSTALIVRGHVMEVVGENQVAVFESASRTESLKPAMLESGDRYNFKDRARVVATTGRASERGGE